ncbi:hypothetical protein ACA910_018752 [Epithemia clementina (nom. ined.)]
MARTELAKNTGLASKATSIPATKGSKSISSFFLPSSTVAKAKTKHMDTGTSKLTTPWSGSSTAAPTQQMDLDDPPAPAATNTEKPSKTTPPMMEIDQTSKPKLAAKHSFTSNTKGEQATQLDDTDPSKWQAVHHKKTKGTTEQTDNRNDKKQLNPTTPPLIRLRRPGLSRHAFWPSKANRLNRLQQQIPPTINLRRQGHAAIKQL